MYLLGYDIGSSSIKAAIIQADNRENLWVVQSPEKELEILAPQQGWAEQHPATWWENVCLATRKLLQQSQVDPNDIKGIGISYQMHGLVLVDKNRSVLRPSIIWCDGRAVEIGNRAFDEIGHDKCLSHFLNSPGNFTASKLKWVQEYEPSIYEKIHKMLLPGDYIAMRLSGELLTTPSGLSEGVLWDFKENKPAELLLEHYGISNSLLPEIKPTFSVQGELTSLAATETGLVKGIPVTYRAGDQPNNALSLQVLNPGEIAATGGTSGVVYGVVDRPVFDLQARVNGFAHVNHTPDKPRIGTLLCINGAGSQYAWMRHQVGLNGLSYKEMEHQAGAIPVGSDGLRILPFGNGAERMLANKDIGSKINNLQFNRHTRSHLYRAALEGVAFSFVYGVNILKEMGLHVQVMRVGNDNLFQSKIFSSTISNLLGCRIELVETTGAIGAAKAAGVANGIYSSLAEATQGGGVVQVFEPIQSKEIHEKNFRLWEADLKTAINS